MTERILREAGIDERVAEAVASVRLSGADEIAEYVGEWLGENEAGAWREAVDGIVVEAAAGLVKRSTPRGQE